MSITPREPADFTPSRGNYTELKPFRFWCQKVLPLVYDDSLSYYELLCKVVDFLNKTMEDVETLEDDVTNLHTAYVELQTYVNEYFSTLDVQEEIDNKLDEMASDGSLTALISPLLPTLIAEWLEENLKPTTPPIDRTLTVENAAADAKAVGDRAMLSNITNINAKNYSSILPDCNIHVNRIFRMYFSGGSTNIPANLPFTSYPTGGVVLTLICSSSDGTYRAGDTQILIGQGIIKYRSYSSSWDAWKDVTDLSVLSNYTNNPEAIIASNYSTLFPDANNIFSNAIYRLSFSTSASIPSNLPITRFSEGGEALFICSTNGEAYTYQLFIYTNVIWYRFYTSSWSNWIKLYQRNIESIRESVTPSNYTTVLPDANSILTNSIYRMYFSVGSTSIPTNLPITRWIADSGSLITFNTDYGSNAGAQQIFVCKDGIFTRQYTNAWQDWKAQRFVLRVGSGWGYSSLTEALALAIKYEGTKVIVYSGTYDLYNEFRAFYGNDFFENFTASTRPKGLLLSNNVHIQFSSNAKIVFNYTGDNVNVLQQFSPLNFLSECVDGFTIENAIVECSRCRYVVHDDPGDMSRAYHNHYLNCHFKIDNTNNASWVQNRVLGGGLGRAGSIEINGCIFEGINPNSSYKNVAFYHQNVSASSHGYVAFKNNYVTGDNTIGAMWGGPSTELTDYIITNNSLGRAVIVEAVNQESTNQNLNVLEWNNVI